MQGDWPLLPALTKRIKKQTFLDHLEKAFHTLRLKKAYQRIGADNIPSNKDFLKKKVADQLSLPKERIKKVSKVAKVFYITCLIKSVNIGRRFLVDYCIYAFFAF